MSKTTTGLIPVNKKKFVLVVGGSGSYYLPFSEFGEYSEDLRLLSGSKEAVKGKVAFVLFTGGEDVWPALYGEATNSRTRYNADRDEQEILAFTLAKAYEIPMVGVCRGSQFLCVMAGGKLVQHVDSSHSRNHDVQMWNGEVISMSSTHHQMQLPPKDAKIIGWVEPPISKVHLNGNEEDIDMQQDIEVVYYPNINAVGMQYHPEIMDKSSPGFKMASKLVSEFLIK